MLISIPLQTVPSKIHAAYWNISPSLPKKLQQCPPFQLQTHSPTPTMLPFSVNNYQFLKPLTQSLHPDHHHPQYYTLLFRLSAGSNFNRIHCALFWALRWRMFEPGILFTRLDKASLVFLDFVLLRITEVPIAAVSEEC